MLVLSRKVGETISIGNDIVVHVTAVQGGRVRIGISAPRDVSVRRGELSVKALPAVAPPAELHQSVA